MSLFEAVLSGRDNVLNAKHANTTIPKFLGALCRYEVDPSETVYLEYADTSHHSFRRTQWQALCPV